MFSWAATSRRDVAKCRPRYTAVWNQAGPWHITERHGGDQDEICGHSVSALHRRFGMKVVSTSAPSSFAVPCTCLAYAESGAPGFCRTHIITAKGQTRETACHKLRRESHRFDARILLLPPKAQAPGHDDYDCNHIHPPTPTWGQVYPSPTLVEKRPTGPFPKQNDLHTTH